MKVFNLNADEWDRSEDRPGWRSKDAWVGARIESELIGGSMYELEPGDRLWPYHTHHANEEWLIVLRGRPTLRTSEGERELAEGHPLLRHVGIVTVTATNLDELEEASARVEQAAAQSLLDLRPLAARQAEGWVASLPLGRSVRAGGWR